MAKKPRILPPETIVWCVTCRKPTNGHGYHGAECQCGAPARSALRGAHGRGTCPPEN